MNPCTPYCPGVNGFPELECTGCQSLFHSKCVGISQTLLPRLMTTWKCRVSIIWVNLQKAAIAIIIPFNGYLMHAVNPTQLFCRCVHLNLQDRYKPQRKHHYPSKLLNWIDNDEIRVRVLILRQSKEKYTK